MNINELKTRLRNDFAKYIIPLVEKDECYICGSDGNLEVHHEVMFCEQLEHVLSLLDLSDEIDEDKIEIIRLMMLGSQVKNKNITLCDKCHQESHRDDGYYDKQKIEKQKEREIYIQSVVFPYVHSVVGNRLFKDEQEKLISVIDLKDKYGRQQKSVGCINEFLSEKIGCNLISKQVKIKGSKKTVWVITQL